ncbi:hypothetical protein TPY_2168 [Sulfobacillus acidophilus TPY]|nr:hypothetical protein TPY_2168 [Sulfobacillus acidophilus TPY]
MAHTKGENFCRSNITTGHYAIGHDIHHLFQQPMAAPKDPGRKQPDHGTGHYPPSDGACTAPYTGQPSYAKEPGCRQACDGDMADIRRQPKRNPVSHCVVPSSDRHLREYRDKDSRRLCNSRAPLSFSKSMGKAMIPLVRLSCQKTLESNRPTRDGFGRPRQLARSRGSKTPPAAASCLSLSAPRIPAHGPPRIITGAPEPCYGPIPRIQRPSNPRPGPGEGHHAEYLGSPSS